MPLVILVGNKKDLDDEREVYTKEAQYYAEKEGVLFYEVSAKDEEDSEFEEIFREISKY